MAASRSSTATPVWSIRSSIGPQSNDRRVRPSVRSAAAGGRRLRAARPLVVLIARACDAGRRAVAGGPGGAVLDRVREGPGLGDGDLVALHDLGDLALLD